MQIKGFVPLVLKQIGIHRLCLLWVALPELFSAGDEYHFDTFSLHSQMPVFRQLLTMCVISHLIVF